MKILIAEDEKNILVPYKIILESRNHEVHTVEDGEKCIQIYRQEFDKLNNSDKNIHPFDIVILDYKMPKKDGLEVAKEIFELVPDQRIVFASAYIKNILVNSTEKLKQATEMLQKPFSLDTLVDKVEDKELFAQLEAYGICMPNPKKQPTHRQLIKILEELLEVEKKYIDE
jgi:CheY-like chemotaxis protein